MYFMRIGAEGDLKKRLDSAEPESIYAALRALKEPLGETLDKVIHVVDLIVSKNEGDSGFTDNPLHAAVAISTMLNLDQGLKTSFFDEFIAARLMLVNFNMGINQIAGKVVAGDESQRDDLPPGLARYVDAQVERRLTKSDIAKNLRPRKKPTIRGVFIAAMKPARRDGLTLSRFIESVKARSVDDLQLRDGPKGSAKYLLSAEEVPWKDDGDGDGDGDKWEKVGLQTLRDWWKAAAKGGLAR